MLPAHGYGTLIMAARLLSADERTELEARRSRLRQELLAIETELRTDHARRVQEANRPVEARPRLRGSWRHFVR